VAAANGQRRARGPNQGTPWKRTAEGGLSLLRLPLDVHDPVQRRRIGSMFSAGFSVYRAVQRDARDRTRAYWAAPRERALQPAAVRERLELSRTGLEHAAYAHVDAAPHLRRSLTKALAMHLADSVWSATERHLFRDATGERHGMPRPGGYLDFARLPGRAKSHTHERKWETFRLHGTLAGHRAAYSRPEGTDDGTFVQPHRLRPVHEPADGWWRYTGPLAVIFTGLPIGTLVLPVRLPTAPCNQPILDHHLADPSRWHKIDLVRYRDPTVEGRWRYEAHLLVLTTPYVARETEARRREAAAATAQRRAGIDVNVSNLTVASHVDGADLRITRVRHDDSAKQAMVTRKRRQRRRSRRLDRSRRATNPAQYELSARQIAHNERRAASGLPPVQMIPRGPRKCRAGGAPQVAHRRDALSNTYRRERAAEASDARAESQARRDLARQIAARFVSDHGCSFVIEDCDLRAWAPRWGARMAAFTPGLLVRALEREASLVAQIAQRSTAVERVSTRSTALSQHCLCGQRARKTLAERTHACGRCGLRGDRDAVSATLAACVEQDTAQTPTAALDKRLAAELLNAPGTRQALYATLPYALCGRQDVRSESTVHSARDGWFVAEKGPTRDLVVVARRIVGRASYPTLDEHGGLGRRTTPDRAGTRTNLTRTWALTQLRASLRRSASRGRRRSRGFLARTRRG